MRYAQYAYIFNFFPHFCLRVFFFLTKMLNTIFVSFSLVDYISALTFNHKSK